MKNYTGENLVATVYLYLLAIFDTEPNERRNNKFRIIPNFAWLDKKSATKKGFIFRRLIFRTLQFLSEGRKKC